MLRKKSRHFAFSGYISLYIYVYQESKYFHHVRSGCPFELSVNDSLIYLLL